MSRGYRCQVLLYITVSPPRLCEAVEARRNTQWCGMRPWSFTVMSSREVRQTNQDRRRELAEIVSIVYRIYGSLYDCKEARAISQQSKFRSSLRSTDQYYRSFLCSIYDKRVCSTLAHTVSYSNIQGIQASYVL